MAATRRTFDAAGPGGYGPLNSQPGTGVEQDLIVKNMGPFPIYINPSAQFSSGIEGFPLGPGETFEIRITGTDQYSFNVPDFAGTAGPNSNGDPTYGAYVVSIQEGN